MSTGVCSIFVAAPNAHWSKVTAHTPVGVNRQRTCGWPQLPLVSPTLQKLAPYISDFAPLGQESHAPRTNLEKPIWPTHCYGSDRALGPPIWCFSRLPHVGGLGCFPKGQASRPTHIVKGPVRAIAWGGHPVFYKGPVLDFGGPERADEWERTGPSGSEFVATRVPRGVGTNHRGKGNEPLGDPAYFLAGTSCREFTPTPRGGWSFPFPRVFIPTPREFVPTPPWGKSGTAPEWE